MPDAPPPLALTLGEPAGVGPEIARAAWLALRATGPAFLLVGDAGLVGGRAVASPRGAAEAFAEALPVLHRPLPGPPPVPGQPNPAHAAAVIGSVREAADLALAGAASGVVTNPIQKATLYAAGFPHPGHTEFLAELAGEGPPVMLLCAEGVDPPLRAVPVTIHEGLRAAVARLDAGLIVATGLALAAGLRRDFGLAAPRIAVAGLNPHAGEGGAMGDEEGRIVAPAIAELRARGVDATGPHPPDTMFAPKARARYDAALCMYHDQALIPVKTLDMAGGVNVTLGLKIVRTSPDHGTALDIAGRGEADPGSLVAAIRLAARLAENRRKGGACDSR